MCKHTFDHNPRPGPDLGCVQTHIHTSPAYVGCCPHVAHIQVCIHVNYYEWPSRVTGNNQHICPSACQLRPPSSTLGHSLEFGTAHSSRSQTCRLKLPPFPRSWPVQSSSPGVQVSAGAHQHSLIDAPYSRDVAGCAARCVSVPPPLRATHA
jgi:hypothetical protein